MGGQQQIWGVWEKEGQRQSERQRRESENAKHNGTLGVGATPQSHLISLEAKLGFIGSLGGERLSKTGEST